MSTAGFLLDTSILSEGSKRSPAPGYLAWLDDTPQDQLFTSCLVIGEGMRGAIMVRDPAKNAALSKYWHDIQEIFAATTLSLDLEVCLLWAELSAAARHSGKMPPYIDSLLAAQALHFDLTLVTRNRKDFEQFEGLRLFCPWE